MCVCVFVHLPLRDLNIQTWRVKSILLLLCEWRFIYFI